MMKCHVEFSTKAEITKRTLAVCEAFSLGEEAKGVINKFTTHGAVPELLRVARPLARSAVKTFTSSHQ